MPAVTVVGIGADGWAGLSPAGQAAIGAAEVVLGGPRQLALVAGHTPAEQREWPSPMLPALPELFAGLAGRRVCALASGDPMHYGLGTTLTKLLGPVPVVAHPSSVSLACARLGWAVESTEVISAVGRPLAALRRVLAPGRRVLVLSAGAATPRKVAALLVGAGYGPSAITVLAQLGGPAESRVEGVAEGWTHSDGEPLTVVGVHCVGDAGLGEVPGLPDAAYDHDGQLTKREVRAVTLALLAPRPGELLWDVGAGNGSIGIEWMRAHRDCRAVAVEADPARAARIARNAETLGVPGIEVVSGRAPQALAGLPAPDAIFVGGGLGASLESCWSALPPGGRLVANGVTLEAEARLLAAHAEHGGSLTRVSVERAAPLGELTGWTPARSVTIWAGSRPMGEDKR